MLRREIKWYLALYIVSSSLYAGSALCAASSRIQEVVLQCPDLLKEILNHLPRGDRMRTIGVCKSWSAHADKDAIWVDPFLERFAPEADEIYRLAMLPPASHPWKNAYRERERRVANLAQAKALDLYRARDREKPEILDSTLLGLMPLFLTGGVLGAASLSAVASGCALLIAGRSTLHAGVAVLSGDHEQAVERIGATGGWVAVSSLAGANAVVATCWLPVSFLASMALTPVTATLSFAHRKRVGRQVAKAKIALDAANARRQLFER